VWTGLNVTVWRPSVCLSVNLSVVGILTVTHHEAACNTATVHFGLTIRRIDKLALFETWCVILVYVKYAVQNIYTIQCAIVAARADKRVLVTLYRQIIGYIVRYLTTTGPPRSATDNDRRQMTTTDADGRQRAKQYWPPTLCVGGPVITVVVCASQYGIYSFVLSCIIWVLISKGLFTNV